MENHHHQHDPAAESDWAAMAELLDLDADVLHSYLSEVTAWVYQRSAELPRRRILDLGSGTGTGALAMVQCFAEADVIALDKSAQLLARCQAKARELGVEDRIRTVQADLDAAWPVIDPVDLVWASGSLHHMADPDRVLTEVFTAIHPGGLLAVAEMDSFPRFLADDAGLGLEARCHAALAEGMAEQVPHLGSDWGSRLRKTGFAIEAERTFVIDLKPPLPVSAGRYAQVSLQRIRSSLEGRMSGDDLAALDALIDSDGPDSVLRRDDLAVRTKRTVWMAKRP
ncbi:MAG: class I SAM-dependent methyltransferase [Streptosporangiaceae bacterium]|jgi:SAM-dependent methyltransferase